MKRVFKIFLVVLICLSFASCDNIFLPVDKLMRPPELSGEDKILQAAFDTSVSEYENVLMKTPVSGKYRSSYILFDIDNDSVEEAIILYSVPVIGNSVIIGLFKHSDGEWKSISQINGSMSEIYEVNFADINGDGRSEILLSWINSSINEENIDVISNGNYSLDIYSYDNGETNLITTENYTNLYVEDLNNNNADELLIFKINFSDLKNLTTVRLLSFNGDYSVNYDKVIKISDMPEIINIANDTIDSNGKKIARIFVDGTFSETETFTEIIEINEDDFSVSLPLFNDSLSTQPSTLRNAKVVCLDVDRDGKIEIPSIEVFPYSQKVSDGRNEPLNLVVWSEFLNNNFSVEIKTIINPKVGHVAVIPEEFIGNISAIYDEENFNLTFYSVNSRGEFEKALFSFRIFTLPDWEENNFNYEMLHKNDTYVYGYLIFKADNYDTYKKFITENFYAL